MASWANERLSSVKNKKIKTNQASEVKDGEGEKESTVKSSKTYDVTIPSRRFISPARSARSRNVVGRIVANASTALRWVPL